MSRRSKEEILTIGDPLLRRVAEPVSDDEFAGGYLADLVERMWHAMKSADGVGLAAPQIGISKRVVIAEVADNPRYPDAPDFDFMVLVNPVITPSGSLQEDGWEGCLSVPGYRGLVPRWHAVHVAALGENGQALDFAARGFAARVFQHECDHLDGVLYVDKLPAGRTLITTEQLHAFLENEEAARG